MSDHTTIDTPNPGPADVFCSKCGRYHASVTCCPSPVRSELVDPGSEAPAVVVFGPTRPEAVREAMGWIGLLSPVQGTYHDKVAAHIRDLEAERDRLKSELAEARSKLKELKVHQVENSIIR